MQEYMVKETSIKIRGDRWNGSYLTYMIVLKGKNQPLLLYYTITLYVLGFIFKHVRFIVKHTY